ncbi:zinc finger protein, putative [Plasmodium relictum]|uniref:Zinc finger protein, putative n=1 Tax=Plasmodium relictum TaxID=85471 RepID=A0A1J1H6X1_PLARL|nr:zinc finger protein, putative [Plasmodium relictum]CRH00665.1 zinc finger protein, putative [Plasmodium relictum]
MKTSQKRSEKKDHTNKKDISNIKNNLNVYTNEDKMRNFKNIHERNEERKRSSNFLILNDKSEFNNYKHNTSKSSISDVSDSLMLNEKQKEGVNNNLITTLIQDIEISNSKLKKNFKTVEIFCSENNFLNSHANEINENINNNINSENINIIISNNSNDKNNDLINESINNELSKKNNLNNKNNSNIFTYSDKQCMNNNSINNIIEEGYSLPLNTTNNNEKEKKRECDDLNNQETMNIQNNSKMDEYKINHENDLLCNISTKSLSLKNNLEEENILKVDNVNENVSNDNTKNENMFSVNDMNMINSNENNINDIILGESNVNGLVPNANNININTESEYFSNTNNENGTLNNTARSRNSNENYSNSEELDYYVLTIADLRNTNENENNGEQEHLPEPRFLSKMFGYEIKPNFEEYNMSKIIRTSLFILIIFILFSIEFSLLYNNILKLKIDSKLILVESHYNNMFLTNFLYQFDEKELNNLIVTNDIIKEEINNGNFMIYNNLCILLKKLRVTCNNLMDYYKADHENIEKLYENTIRAFEELQRKDIIVYRVNESVFIRCNDITTRNLKNNENNIFLFVFSNKYLKISKLFLILTLFFFFVRIALILSRILYEFVLLSCYRDYKLSLSCKRMYLAKYVWSVCTILILEIILGDDCIIWWLHDVDPLFNYHFQYFVWIISLLCFLSFVFCKILRKYSEARNHDYSNICFLLNFFHEFLFGANILFACIFILLNVHKSAIITIIVTVIVLLIDILNDSYVQQAQAINSQPQRSNRPPKKKFYVIENKKKSVKVITLVRINEHIYREIASGNLSKSNNNKNKDSFDSYKIDNTKWWNKKRKIFNLRNIFNKKYLSKNKDFKKPMSNNINTCNSHKLYDLNSSTLEYCEICDERSKNVVLYPCMHGGFCETCIRSLIINSLKSKDALPHCPFCRNNIKNVYKISYEDEQRKVQANTILTIQTK